MTEEMKVSEMELEKDEKNYLQKMLKVQKLKKMILKLLLMMK
ncbi:hypothetical protein PL321_15860 [Caloramator sp. mosi_1]|nr:hypothetical protein [Caloramator sp. mosi_1]WDC83901.1 hypothetical protein PL321_15860 [Caloramator sp. mosi_1]